MDAGPLIHLDELDCLSLLNIFKILHIPNAVWAEAVQKDRVNQASLLNLQNVQRHALHHDIVEKFIKKYKLEALHAGECECLFLCKQNRVTLMLTDDLAARNFAKQLNLTPVGSLGIIIKAYQQGMINLEEAEYYILRLYDVSSLYVTRTIVELAIEQLRQHSIRSRDNKN
ncbi:MAG: hypothetical protein ACE5IW_13420 [bacterium]